MHPCVKIIYRNIFYLKSFIMTQESKSLIAFAFEYRRRLVLLKLQKDNQTRIITLAALIPKYRGLNNRLKL